MTLPTVLCVAAILSAPPATSQYVIGPRMESKVRLLVAADAGLPALFTPITAKLSVGKVELAYAEKAKKLTHKITLVHPSQGRPSDIKGKGFAVRTTLSATHPLTVWLLATLPKVAKNFQWKARGIKGTRGDPLREARSRLYMNDMAGLLNAAAKVRTWAPDDPSTAVQLALILKAAGQDEQAKAEQLRAKALIARIPTNTATAEELASQLLDGPVAQSAIDALLAKSAASACSLVVVVDGLRLLKQSSRAQTLVDQILQRSANCKEAHHHAMEIAARAFDWKALLKRVDQAEEILKDKDAVTVQRATALRGLERYVEARDILEELVRRNPRATGGLSQLTNLYNITMSQGKVFQKVKAKYVKNPKDFISGYLAGVMAHYLGKHTESVRLLTPLIARFPHEPRVAMYAAISSLFMGRQKEAERLIAQAHAIAGAMDPDVYYCRAIIIRKKNMAQAIKDLEHFLAVAKLGWHSKGKLKRVRGELALLKKGIIPPPAEAHHRPETPATSVSTSPPESDAQAEKPSDDEPTSITGHLALGGLVIVLLLLWLKLRRADET